jgi:hypothetical protein
LAGGVKGEGWTGRIDTTRACPQVLASPHSGTKLQCATHGELYLAGAAVAVATGAVFAWADRRRNVAVTSDEASLPQLR